MTSDYLVAIYPAVMRDGRNNRFYAYLVGKPSYHIMDWRGPNYHIARIKEQPKSGFATIREAKQFGKDFVRVMDERRDRTYPTLGQFLTDGLFAKIEK